jgi:hypothetical protein
MLFLSPFVVISLFILIMDPYNLFGISSLVSDEIKIECLNRNGKVQSRANATWRILKFLKDPAPNVILGDSRIADINDTSFEEKLGGKVSNLAIPSGNIRTINDLFWMASAQTKLDHVIIQINFNRYNAAVNRDMLLPVKQLIDKPYIYFFNANYVKDSYAVFSHAFKKNKCRSDSLTKAVANWRFSEEYLMNDIGVRRYAYPEDYYNMLREISAFCDRENIDLLFVIMPNYYTVYQYVERFNFQDEYERFKTDIKSLGTTVDLEVGLPISYNMDMYSDHFHIQPQLADTLISLMFNKSGKDSK